MKQLTVPLLPDPNCSMPENDAQCVIPVKRTSGGFVHVYKIIKQLYHACSGNSQNYCPEVLEMIWEPLPSAFGAGDDLGTVLKSSPAHRDNSFDCSLNRHEITVYCPFLSQGICIIAKVKQYG